MFKFFTNAKKPPGGVASLTKYMSGSALLSHGETPHYHRRYGVSLLSSAWDQVGPPRYGRQTNSVFNPEQAAVFHLKLRLSLTKTPSVLSG